MKVLIDDSSLISWASSTLVERLGLKTVASNHAAEMPDGTRHLATSTMEPVNLKIEDYEDSMQLAVCPLAGYDIILGKKWHEDYKVRKDYHKNRVSFRKGGKRITLRATLTKSDNIISKHKLVKNLKRRNPVFAVILRSQEPLTHSSVNTTGLADATPDKDIQDLLTEFKDVFPDELPKGLPPKRKQQFKIELTHDAKPHKKGIYRLSEAECQELLKQLRELIDKGFIQPSTSP